MDKIEFNWAIQQLVGTGHAIQKRSQNSQELVIGLTDQGMAYAENIINGLDVQTRLCLVLYFNNIRLDAEEDNDN